jgi:hypothetical protein
MACVMAWRKAVPPHFSMCKWRMRVCGVDIMLSLSALKKQNRLTPKYPNFT